MLRIVTPIVVAALAIASPAAAGDLGTLSPELIGRTLLGCLHPTGRFRAAEDVARASDGTTAEAIRAKSGADAVRLVRIAWTGAIRDKAYGTDVALLERGQGPSAVWRIEILADSAVVPALDRTCRDALAWLAAE